MSEDNNQTNQSPQGNKFTVYWGILAEDKAAGSREVRIYLQELLPFTQGELEPKEIPAEATLNDSKQGEKSSTVTTTNTVTATYLGDDANRTFPPDVVKGEQVWVVNYTNTDTYYWKASGRNNELRILERYQLHVANSKERVKMLDDTNTYLIRMDTLTAKEIRIQTSKSDGEKFIYTFLIDAKKNTIQLMDDNNNELYINSEEHITYMRNTDGCMLSFDKRNGLLVIPDSLTIKAGKQIVIDTPNIRNVNNSGDGCTEWNTNSITFKCGSSFVVKSPAIGLHGAVEATTIVTDRVQSTNYLTGKY